MIEYIVSQNPDDRIILKASQILKNGGLICFPTETNWILAADPYHKKSVDKLYHIKHVDNTKHFTILCASFKRAMEIAHIDDNAFAMLKKVIPGPYTFIFAAQKKITKYLKASKIDHQVGVRFSPNHFCQEFLKIHDDVVICTSIDHALLSVEDDTLPIYSALIEDELGHQIDLILDPGDYEFIGSTTIVDFTTGVAEVQRIGVGDPKLFL